MGQPRSAEPTTASVRIAGAAGMLGGLLWIIGTAIHASRPVGCVVEECASRAMRDSSLLEGVLGIGALLLMAVAAVALVVLTRRAGRFGKLGGAAAFLVVAGVAVLVVAMFVQAALFGGDFELMPYFVIPGALALVAGVVLLASVVLRSGVLPRWAAVALVVGALAMVAFNEQTTAAWLGIPFGIAWIGVGYALWTHERSVPAGRD